MAENVDSSSKDNKRKKHYKFAASKRKRAEPGMKGFLCSCNFREKDCVRESYNVLNEYADTLYGLESKETSNENQEDIDDLLKEIEDLKSKNTTTKRRFQVVESGAKNFLFIRTTLEDPVQLAHAIVKDIHDTKNQKTRFLLRLLPVEVTCKAYLDDIKKSFESLLQKYFKDNPVSYSIVINKRNNNKLSKEDVITSIASLVSNERSDHSVNLKNGDLSIVIEIVRNIAYISVVPNFLKYRKYNLHTICNPDNKVASEVLETNTEIKT